MFAILAIFLVQLALGQHMLDNSLDYSNVALGQNEKLYINSPAMLMDQLNINSKNPLMKESYERKVYTQPYNKQVLDFGAVQGTSAVTPVLVENWPTVATNFGQVTAVAIDPKGNPVVFHRADRYWTAK